MRKSISTILLGVLITLFSGCFSQDMSLPSFGAPSFSLSKKQLDRNLPTVQHVKIKTSLSQVALEWKPIHDRQISGYRILRNDGKGGFKLIKVINDPYIAHYTDSNLQQNKFNNYLVSAYTNDGRVSMPISARVPRTNKPLAAVPFATAVSALPNRVKILWRIHPDERISSYLVQKQAHKSNSWRTIATVDKRLSVEYIDTDVKPGIQYSYRVLARTAEGILSPPSQVVSGASKRLPPPITGVMATTNLAKKVEIIWQASPIADAAFYRIYASDFADGLYTFIAKTKATHYTDRFDRNGATRFYKISVMDKDGLESSHGKPTKGATIGFLRAPNITVARIINNRVEIQWTKTDPRTVSYIIYKKYWDGWRPKKIKIIDFKETMFIDSKIRPDTTYTYYVIAVDKNGIPSAPSRSVKFSVDNTQENSQQKKSWF